MGLAIFDRILGKNGVGKTGNKVANRQQKHPILLLILRFAPRDDERAPWIFFLIYVFCGALCVGDMCGMSSVLFIKAKLHALVLPVKRAINSMTEIPRMITGYVDIKEENRRLQQELDMAKSQIVCMGGAEQELRELRAAIDLKYELSNFKSIEKVLGFDETFRNSFLIISATHPVSKPGSVVVSCDGLVGVIHDVSGQTARVMTVADNRLFIPVTTASGKFAVLRGGCSDGVMKSVAVKDEQELDDFAVDEVLSTSGEGGVFPVGIPVARLSRVDGECREIIAAHVFTPTRLGFVWVVPPIATPLN